MDIQIITVKGTLCELLPSDSGAYWLCVGLHKRGFCSVGKTPEEAIADAALAITALRRFGSEAIMGGQHIGTPVWGFEYN